MVDKADAKEYIVERIGKEYIVPTLGVWDSFEEIDFASLPDQFVLNQPMLAGLRTPLVMAVTGHARQRFASALRRW